MYLDRLTEEQKEKLLDILSDVTKSEIKIEPKTTFFYGANNNENNGVNYYVHLYSDGRYIGYASENMCKENNMPRMKEFNIKFIEDVDEKMAKNINAAILSYMVSTYGKNFREDYVNSYNKRIHRLETATYNVNKYNSDLTENYKNKIKEINGIAYDLGKYDEEFGL